MKKNVVWLLFALLPILGLQAAEIDKGLAEALDKADPNKEFHVIVVLNSPRDIYALDQELHARRAPLAERHVTVIDALKANANETQPAVLDWLAAQKESGKVTAYRNWWIANILTIDAPVSTIMEIAKNPAVKSVAPGFRAQLIEPIRRGPWRSTRPGNLDTEQTTPGQDAIGATRVNREMGLNGEGVLVANLDTGVEGSHPALSSRWRGNHAPISECWKDALGGQPNPTDGFGHGTHVMGTICGREIDGQDTNTVGSAPLAEWIADNAINQGVGGGFDQDIFDAFEWFADPDGNPNTMEDVPDVVQNSWGVFTGLGYAQCFDDWNEVVTNCEAVGVVVTWSAGNEATSGLRSPAIFQLNETQIFAVAAVDVTNHPNPPFPIADFSSRGPTPCEPNPGAHKPEIAAPGVSVYSSVPGGGYDGGWSGTSMAGPHVAGVVALMREACPDCDPQTIKEAIMATAIDNGYPPTGDDDTFGAGFIDAWEAVNSVSTLGRVAGFCRESNNSPLQGVRVQPIGLNNSASSRADGSYSVSAAEGTYTVRYTKFGYETVEVPNVQTFEGDTTFVDVTMDQVPNGTIRITVTTQLGQPVQGVEVTFPNTPIDTLITNGQGQITQQLPATTFPVHLHQFIDRDPPINLTLDTTVTVVANQTTDVTLVLLNYLIEPTGADAYGYRAYDRYDRDLAAPTNWLELSPDSGGPGIPFAQAGPGHDSSNYFATPFSIGFYGQDYDMMTVNTNGWMLPGEIHEMAGARDTFIPSNPASPPDPPGVIATFWDDVRLGGQLFRYYDQAGGRWIFQFQNQQLRSPAGQLHTWQVQFLDPARVATRTGDCDIIMLYHRMDYPQTCTIGIENPAENTGVQVLHNDELDSTAWPITNGAALRFTTGRAAPNSPVGTINGTVSLYPTYNGNITTWVAGNSVTLNAQHQYTAANIPAGTAYAAAFANGYEPARSGRIAVPANGSVNNTIEAWRLDPPREIGASLGGDGFTTVSWRSPESVEFHANPAVRYDLYGDGVLLAGSLDQNSIRMTFAPGDTIVFFMIAHYRRGTSNVSEAFTYIVPLAAGEENSALPREFALYQNFPNPFNPSTSIRFDVPFASHVRLTVYNVAGQQVAQLVDGQRDAGRYTMSFDARNLSTGIYIYSLEAGSYRSQHKMLLIK